MGVLTKHFIVYSFMLTSTATPAAPSSTLRSAGRVVDLKALSSLDCVALPATAAGYRVDAVGHVSLVRVRGAGFVSRT